MTRTVTITRDAVAPIWRIACVRPCEGRTVPCMKHPLGTYPPICYLGSARSQAAAWQYAKSLGYTVETEI